VSPGANYPAGRALSTGILQAAMLAKVVTLSADAEGRVTGCNEAALDFFGDIPALLGRPLATFFSPENAAEQKRLQQTIVTAKRFPDLV